MTDITEQPTAGSKLYCCAIKDVFSKRIVDYAIDERMTAQLAVTALRTAVAVRRPGGVVVVPSDHGCSFEHDPGRAHRRQAPGVDGPRRLRGRITPPWIPGAHCGRRTSWNAAAGAPATNSTPRSCSGSDTPTTADGAWAPSASPPRRVRTRLHH
ncbi:hypothetical protein DQ239_19495 [Blastococcus sp. TF02-09]|nr:hypothetical protein DQ239_19495 [Blastococcus sp. TF02-9]